MCNLQSILWAFPRLTSALAASPVAVCECGAVSVNKHHHLEALQTLSVQSHIRRSSHSRSFSKVGLSALTVAELGKCHLNGTVHRRYRLSPVMLFFLLVGCISTYLSAHSSWTLKWLPNWLNSNGTVHLTTRQLACRYIEPSADLIGQPGFCLSSCL